MGRGVSFRPPSLLWLKIFSVRLRCLCACLLFTPCGVCVDHIVILPTTQYIYIHVSLIKRVNYICNLVHLFIRLPIKLRCFDCSVILRRLRNVTENRSFRTGKWAKKNNFRPDGRSEWADLLVCYIIWNYFEINAVCL